MADHKHGEMEISVQEKTYAGFIDLSVKSVIAIIVFLVFLAIFAS